jgi:hypothetical protein
VLLCIPHYNTAARNSPSLHEINVSDYSKEDMIYPLTVKEIAVAQEANPTVHKLASDPKYTRQLVENTQILCKGTAIVLPTALWHRAISWYHHYLQHPRAACLEETLCAVMYWKGMQITSGNMSKTVINAK